MGDLRNDAVDNFVLNHSDGDVSVTGVEGEELLTGCPVTGTLALAPRTAAVIARRER